MADHTLRTQLIKEALLEDMPDGDRTTDSLGLEPRMGHARLIAKDDLVLSGLELFEQTVKAMDPDMDLKWQFQNGDSIIRGQTLCGLKGDLLRLLKAERVALNFLGRLSGIATLTRRYVEKVKHTSTQILDTRKTTPGFRILEKRAVRDGGAFNHRMSLSDAVLIKENHIRAVGGLTDAVLRVRANSSLPIEVEAHSLEDVQECVKLRVQRILLDNMENDTLKHALHLIPTEIQTEASGNMTLDRVKSVAELGVNYISVGALTHSAPTADLSLMFDWSSSRLTTGRP